MQRAHFRHGHPEDGYVLIGVVFFVALVLLSLAVAAPKVAAAIQRDRELELVNRGEQYKRAIKLYYKKFGAYPSTMDQLEKTNNIRFLRKRYVDPFTGKDDWKLIHMGEAHLHPLGFFGQPLTATSPIGGATGLNGGGLNGGTSSTLGQGSSQMGSTAGSGLSNTISTSQSGGGGLYAGVDNSGSGTGTGAGTGSGSGTSSGSGSGSSSGSSGLGANTSQTLGGAPIVGVLIPSEKSSILEYKLQKTYKAWEFVYDPVAEQAAAAGSLLGGSSNLNGASGTSGGIGSSGSNTGSGTGGGSGTGSGGVFGNSGGAGFGTGGTGTSGTGTGSGGTGTGGTGTGGTTPQ